MDTDDIEEIRRILKYYFCDHFEELGKVQKAFLGFDKEDFNNWWRFETYKLIGIII